MNLKGVKFLPEVLFDIAEKPDWNRMELVMQQFDEEEQQSIYNMIRGAQVIKRLGQEREDHHSA